MLRYTCIACIVNCINFNQLDDLEKPVKLTGLDQVSCIASSL